jgi:hypothetical protein
MRRVFSASLTSSGIRFDASVFGRSEYLKENMLWYSQPLVSDSVSSKSASSLLGSQRSYRSIAAPSG